MNCQILAKAEFGTTVLHQAGLLRTPQGRVREINLASGDYWEYEYDDMGQLTSAIKHDDQDEALPGYSFGYGFDSIGNRQSAERSGSIDTYTPNGLNQITEIDHAGAYHLLGTADPSADVTLNGAPAARFGNFYYALLSGEGLESFTLTGTLTGAGHNGSDAVASIAGEVFLPEGQQARTHDQSGNLLEDARWTYRYDAENRLVQMETLPGLVAAGVFHERLSFGYDSQHRRVSKTVEHWDSGEEAFVVQAQRLYLWNGEYRTPTF